MTNNLNEKSYDYFWRRTIVSSVRPSDMEDIKITLFVDSNGTHLHQIYTGLYMLWREGKIRLHLRRGNPITKKRPNRQFVTMLVECGGKSSLCAFDIQDSPALGLPDVIEQCDVYFKRSLEPETFETVSAPLRSRLKPFGFNYQVVLCPRLMFLQRFFLEYLSRPYNPFAAKNGFHLSNVKELFDVSWRGSRMHMLSPDEIRPHNDKLDDSVLFQCRLWDPNQVAQRNRADTESTNEQRIELVRALKKELGRNFIGGLQHNEYTNRVAPDLLIADPAMSRRNEYIQLVRRAGIVISSRGLLGSNGWKLGEYVALGKCILSEPIATVLPGRFSDGEHYSSYDSTEICLQKIQELLGGKRLVSAFSENSRTYYYDYLEPAQMMLNHIETSLGIKNSVADSNKHLFDEVCARPPRDKQPSRLASRY